MSYLIKEVDIDIKTGKSALVSETIVEGTLYKGDDPLVRFLAERCLEGIRKEKAERGCDV
jgi:hypothetical protein